MRMLNVGLIVAIIEAIPPLRNWVNRKVIDRIVSVARTRPHPYSTLSSYTSWRSLTDKQWSGRHLSESELDQDTLPTWQQLEPVFKRTGNGQRLCPKSTCLFPAFAQYLTDGFIRTETGTTLPNGDDDPDQVKRNTSNHDIDLCTLYGRTKKQTDALRAFSQDLESRGRLKSQYLKGEEFSPFLFENGKIKQEFGDLDVPLGLDRLKRAIASGNPDIAEPATKKRDFLFAVGGDRVNSVPQTATINTLLLREHNRIAGELCKQHPDPSKWDDDRVFETARMIVIVQFIKIVVEDYINHIAPVRFKLRARPSDAWNAKWNRPNWITTEFSLLYRWHALIPDEVDWGGKAHPVGETFMNNEPLIETGLKKALEGLSAQPAGELGPQNTTDDLLHVEEASIAQGRYCKLKPYNAYRDYIQRDEVSSFSEISSNPDVASALATAYKNKIEDVDYFVGIFCEDRVKNSPLPRTILSMVALDAFSQALPNPLLSEHVFNEETFTKYGKDQIDACSSLKDLAERQPDMGDIGRVSFTRSDWRLK